MLNTRQMAWVGGLWALCLSASWLNANVTPVTRGRVQGGTVLPTTTTDVRVLRERLTVDVTPIEKRHVTPLVSVAAEYELRHDGKEPIALDVAFPLAGQFEDIFARYGDRTPVAGLGYEVTLDGNALDARAEALPVPRTARSPMPWARGYTSPDAVEAARLTAALVRWVSSDPKLAGALAEYGRIAPSWETYSRVREAFEKEAQSILMRTHLATSVDGYLRNRDDFSAISELIAEADPGKRKQISENKAHYVSTVPQSPRPDQATVDAYRKAIDAWLATHPPVAARHAELVRQYDVQRAARTFMAEGIAPQLRSRPGLSALATARLLQYFENAYNHNPRGYDPKKGWAAKATSVPTSAPDEWLVAQVDPEVERERQRRIAEADALLDRYGFDASFLSPLTAASYTKRVGWRDDSTWNLLKFTAPPTMDEQSTLGKHVFERDSYSTVVTLPRSEAKLIRFTIPMQPSQTRTLRVSYRALAEVDDLAMGQGFASQIVHVRYILKTARNWKSFGPIELTVTLPTAGLVVMEPPPAARRELEGRADRVRREGGEPRSEPAHRVAARHDRGAVTAPWSREARRPDRSENPRIDGRTRTGAASARGDDRTGRPARAHTAIALVGIARRSQPDARRLCGR